MGRAENRRKQREEEAQRKKGRNAGIPLAPVRLTNLQIQEVANLTGTKIAALEQWKKEQTEEIRKAAILETQEKLDRAEEYISLCNILTSLKALEGFRYAKAAANYMVEHYPESAVSSNPGIARKTYEELHEKWGVEIEFDEPDLNKEMGFDVVDWRYEYIKHRIPSSVFDKIWNDAENAQAAFLILAAVWELCEEFNFHKHQSGSGNMLIKFRKGFEEKQKKIEQMEHGVETISKMLKQKYEIEIGWSDNIQGTIDRFDL